LDVHGNAERRTHFVLAPIETPDGRRVVVYGVPAPTKVGGDFFCRLDDAVVLFQERQHRDLDRRQFRMKFKNDSLFASDLFLVISVDQEREGRSIGSGRRLDDIRNDLLFALLIEIFEGFAAELGVLSEVKVGAICHAF
jgi:hypothetical protein